MTSKIILVLSVVTLAFGLSNAALSCYSCSGKGSDCPKQASEDDLGKMNKVGCESTLSTVCAKYSIDLLNGESYTYRSCEPRYIGGIASNGTEFCNFIKELYDPIVNEGLVGGSVCQTCRTLDCNT
ncbi:unnamed protein product [Ceutorhynchus assimilis]|uniref:Sodefrin-like factor n=1 Tax=Ceutorhynchus assimilis TaxID=467358 RepID=A0A9N9QJ66_9CUCU|nr:unnamed protein product [Ceutorhynchus assimilis]